MQRPPQKRPPDDSWLFVMEEPSQKRPPQKRPPSQQRPVSAAEMLRMRARLIEPYKGLDKHTLERVLSWTTHDMSVESDECNHCNGARCTRGPTKGNDHRQIYFDRKERGAHRVMYKLFKAPIPDGLCVLHAATTLMVDASTSLTYALAPTRITRAIGCTRDGPQYGSVMTRCARYGNSRRAACTRKRSLGCLVYRRPMFTVSLAADTVRM